MSGGSGPVDQWEKVTEFSYSEIPGSSEGKDRNGSSGASEMRPVESGSLMLPCERTTLDRAVQPLVFYQSGALRGVVLPFRPVDEAVTHDDIVIALEIGSAEVLDSHAPHTAIGPGHRILAAPDPQGEAFSPLCPVLDSECYLHASNDIANPPPGAILTWRLSAEETVCSVIEYA